MTTQIETTWAKSRNPYTGRIAYKEVPIPKVAMPRKGQTKYDAEFEKLLEGKTALQSTEDGFEVLRRAMQRFLEFRNLKDKMSIRRQMDRKTRAVVLWIEPRKEK